MTPRGKRLLTHSHPGPTGRVAVVGILNVTPDSFSDGGRYVEPAVAAARAEEIVAEGGDALDIGAESTRPGAAPVPEDEELRRLLPVLKAVRARVEVPILVDTYKAGVARAALDEGADAINDVSAGRDPSMFATVAAAGAPIVLMHMQGAPATMQDAPIYPGDDVIGAVRAFLQDRVAAALAAGVARDRIVVDPGIGFGKTPAHNLALISRLEAIVALGHPVLIGPSRKRFIAAVVNGAPLDRLEGTAAAVALAIDRGASLVRVHDIAPMVRVARMAEALRRFRRIPAAGGDTELSEDDV
jgi:dihydropteroate synthase